MRTMGQTVILCGAADRRSLGKNAGGLRLVMEPAAEPVDFALLDCFDRSLGNAGQLLIEAGGELILLRQDGICCAQTAERRGNFAADLAPGPVRDALSSLSPLRSLLALGRGQMERQRASLRDDEDKTQARVLLHRLRPAGGGNPVTLAELQPLRGYDGAFDQLSRRVRGAGPSLELSALPKTLFPGCLRYDPKPAIPITPEMPAVRAATLIITAQIAVARQNEPGVIADIDTEFLHDYRVSLRKIRSVLSLFKGVYASAQTEVLKAGFSALMEPTGRLRDLDVYLLERQMYFDLLPETLHPGLSAMFDMFARERAAVLEQLVKRFRSARYGREIGALEALFATPERLEPGGMAGQPALAYARRLIWKRYRKVCKIARAIHDGTPDHEVHALRISCKKLRYLMEFFAPLFPAREMKKLIKPLKRLQDNLGLFNDFSVQQASLRAFLDSHRAGDRDTDLAIAQSVGALIAVLHQRQTEERARVLENFAGFDSPAVQAAFRDLFHVTTGPAEHGAEPEIALGSEEDHA